MTVVLPVLRAVAAAQIFVVHQLDAALADEVALPQVFVFGEIFFTDFADEAHHMRGHRRVRIVAALHRIDVELGERDRLRLERRDLIDLQVLRDHQRLRDLDRFPFFETGFDLLRRNAEDLREEHRQFGDVIRIALHERLHHDAIDRQRVRRLIVREDFFAAAIEDQAALGGDDELAQRVRFGKVAPLFRLHALDEPERAGEEHEEHHDSPEESVDAESEELLIVSINAHRSRG